MSEGPPTPPTPMTPEQAAAPTTHTPDAPPWLCRIDPPEPAARSYARHGIWARVALTIVMVFVGMFALGAVIFTLAAMGLEAEYLALAIVLIFVLAVGGAASLDIANRRSTRRRIYAESSKPAWRSAAMRAWATGFVWYSRRRINGPTWYLETKSLETCDDAGPRPCVIVCGTFPLPSLADTSEPLFEQVDAGGGRTIRPAEFRRRVTLLCLPLIFWVPMALATGGRLPPGMWVLLVVGVVLPAWAILQRKGLVPIAGGSALSQIGEVTRAGMRGVRTFTTRDSVLALVPDFAHRGLVKSDSGRYEMSGVPIVAWLLRRDGSSSSVKFTDWRDPGLADLLARWVAGWEGGH